MLRYIILRLVLLIPVLLGVSLIVFVLLHLGNGDPALDYLRLSQIPPTDTALAEARHALGLDRPCPSNTSPGYGMPCILISAFPISPGVRCSTTFSITCLPPCSWAGLLCSPPW